MHRGRTIHTLEEFEAFTASLAPTGPVAADVETYKTRPLQPGALLLGLAITGQSVQAEGELLSAYICFHQYNRESKMFIRHLPFVKEVAEFLQDRALVGWNVPFDKAWLDHAFKINTTWSADGRILWHLQNNDPMIRGFGLKLAQKKLLGWENANDEELESHVKASGGRLSNGDHYLADLDILSHYACLDTYSTLM